MNAPAVQLRERISFDEFLADYDGVRAEWVDGEVVLMSPASDRHEDLVSFLLALFRLFAEEKGLGVVRGPNTAMRIGDAARQPDVLFVAKEHRERLRPTFLDGPADLVVEVISPDSRVRDRGEKFYEYEQAGIREYWLIDPLRQQVELYRQGARGTYEPVAPGEPPRLDSEVMPGMWIDPRWLWSEDLPTLNRVQREWGLI